MKEETVELKYTGKSEPAAAQNERPRLSPYLPSTDLVNVVNLAIFLQKRPLLIKGDPGSGKTRLARAVADELDLPYFEWHIKSTSRARDGLYIYDAVRRLHDAQLARTTGEGTTRVENIGSYIKMGVLGKAFRSEKRAVVLIDEIDKADIDFPNDLLLELDEQRFFIEELNYEVKAKQPPIFIITSNDEKDLPDAFLRRCVFYYIEFPSADQLEKIIHAHFEGAPEALVKASVERFIGLRETMEKDKGKAGKKVSTSELLDWFAILNQYPEDEALAYLKGKLPFAEVLLKRWEDHLRYIQSKPESK
jgi:MoxR-like ATPase